jgi:hypothetical protein
VLPKLIALLGLYYILCGTLCLLMPVSLFQPWIMGGVFFAGEWAGGIIFHYDKATHLSVGDRLTDFLFHSSREVS